MEAEIIMENKNKNRKPKDSGILNKMLIPVVAVVAVLAVAIVGVMGVIFYNSYQSRVVSDSEAETALIGKNVAAFLSEAYAISEELANDPDILSMDTAAQTPVLEKCVERNPYLELLYIQDTAGEQTGRSSGELANRSDRWWFKQTVAEQKSFVSKSYYSVNTGSPCASVFFPMYDDGGSFIGIFATDIKLSSLVDLVSAYSKPDEDKTVFIVDGEGTVVAHPDASYIEELYNYVNYTKTVSVTDASGNVMTDEEGNILEEEQPLEVSDSFKAMIEKVMAQESGSSIVEIDGAKYYASYSPILLDGESDSWSIITVQKRATQMMTIYTVLGVAALIAVMALILSIIFVRKTMVRITGPISEITDVISVASEGDFSVKAAVEDSDSEIGLLASSFNNMSEKISRVLGETKRLLDDVKGSSEKLAVISEETDEVVSDMEEISSGAESQSQDTAKMVELTKRLGECNETLLKMSEQLRIQSTETGELSADGLKSVEELRNKSGESLRAVEASYEKILELNESSKQIDNIVQEINEISNQTSLLALNASIEAAHAGEAGKGFAVVAEEVSNLAGDSAAATENIEKIVKGLQQVISDIVTEIDEIKTSFAKQIESVESVEQSFERFRESSSNSAATVDQVSVLIDTVDGVNKEVISSIDNIHAISSSTEENARRVSEQMKRQKEDISEIAGKVEKMNTASMLLEDEMSNFTIV